MIETERYGIVYSEKDQQRIAKVVEEQGLKPLFTGHPPTMAGSDRIVIIELDGKRYAVDPIEDSDDSILSFLGED